MLEKDIVNAIKRAVQERGAWVIKTHGSPHLAGVPDLLLCYRGYFVAMEVKRPETRGTVTMRQRVFLNQIAEAGGLSGVVVSVDEAMILLDAIDSAESAGD